MHKIIGSSARDCVLIILFQLNGSKAGFFESQYDPPPLHLKLHIGKRTNPILIQLNTILKQPI